MPVRFAIAEALPGKPLVRSRENLQEKTAQLPPRRPGFSQQTLRRTDDSELWDGARWPINDTGAQRDRRSGQLPVGYKISSGHPVDNIVPTATLE
ncbi:hypothetical protein CH063_14660 [Colletotrichum higginsianum]|uniref:Uncharacterized protein n=1 Tax=Colletotrichum higginsianum (strain IMI 349063) TaxID=759273 RepID=H1VZI5_COLHI|nr:hypothetical protein CH063_14660 [Colletotrichum higginsianum]